MAAVGVAPHSPDAGAQVPADADAPPILPEAAQGAAAAHDRILRTVHPPAPSGPWAHGFGHSLARSGDLLLVGNALSARDGKDRAGAVHVYGVGDGALVRTLHYAGGAHSANRYFGSSIATVDGGQVAVGARGYDASGRFAGSVQVLDPATGAHARTIPNPSATTSGGGAGDAFGAFTASLGDKLAVSAHRHDAAGVADAGRVYIYNVSNGALLWALENPDPDAGDQFGAGLAAFEDATGEYVYAGSRDDNGGGWAVYAFRVGSTEPAWAAAAPPGATGARHGHVAIVPDGEGGVFVREAHVRQGAAWGAKARHHGPDGSLLGTVEAGACCPGGLGGGLAVANGLLYSGERHAVGGGGIMAHGAADHGIAGSFRNPAASSTHFGFALEPLGGTLLAASERAGPATRVHVLDLPGMAGTVPPAESGAAGPPRLFAPTLVSTSFWNSIPHEAYIFYLILASALASTDFWSGTITLTYDVEIDPFEVDIDDYELGGGLTAVSATASGRVVTIEYISSAAGVSGASSLTVKMVGDIGLYGRQGGAGQ